MNTKVMTITMEENAQGDWILSGHKMFRKFMNGDISITTPIDWPDDLTIDVIVKSVPPQWKWMKWPERTPSPEEPDTSSLSP